jgi:hypothetical protein
MIHSQNRSKAQERAFHGLVRGVQNMQEKENEGMINQRTLPFQDFTAELLVMNCGSAP